MSDKDIEIAALRGEVALLKDELRLLRNSQETHGADPDALSWWAEEMMFWRSKYLADHPEHHNAEYVHNARQNERRDVQIFVE